MPATKPSSTSDAGIEAGTWPTLGSDPTPPQVGDEVARRLHRDASAELTRWDAQIWLTLQAKWDLRHALHARGSRPKVKALSTAPASAR